MTASVQLQYRPWSTSGPVYIGETFQDPEDGTIIKVVRATNRSRLNYAELELQEKWPKVHYCCKDSCCHLCVDYRRTTRAQLCLAQSQPNGSKFKQALDDILRTR